jgi:small subunit ribosomal protein S20
MPGLDRAGQLQEAVCQRGFAVVYMRYYAKVAYPRNIQVSTPPGSNDSRTIFVPPWPLSALRVYVITVVDSKIPVCYNSAVSRETARTAAAHARAGWARAVPDTKEEVMPNIKSQWKRMRKSEDQRIRNKGIKSALKTDIKKFETAIAAGEADAAQESFADASRALDKAASKGVIHKNKAANKKSRMSHALSQMQ